MTSKWNGMRIDLSGKKAKITPPPIKQKKEMQIEVGDFFLVTTKNGAQYDGQVINLTETTLTIEHWNEVKDRLDETDLQLNDITMLEGFNDSQTTL